VHGTPYGVIRVHPRSSVVPVSVESAPSYALVLGFLRVPRRTLRLNGLHGLKPILRGLDSRMRGNDNRGATAAGLELLEEAEVVFCEVADVGDRSIPKA